MERATVERATLWSAIDIGARQGTQFVVTIILARLLTPADFGVVAITMFFSALATFGIQNVVSTALLRSPKSTLDEESTLHWLNIGVSAVCAVLLLLVAPSIAGAFGLAILTPLMAPVAIQIAFGAFGTVPGAIMIRAMRFRQLAAISLVSNLIGGISGIALAFLGLGPWALALQVMIGITLNMIGCVTYSGWRPKFQIRLQLANQHLRFSSWFAISSVLELLYLQISTLLIGRFYGPAPLGIYTRASSIQLLTANLVQAVIGRVSLPVFASRNDEPERLRTALLGSLHLVMFVFVPVLIGVGSCAPEVLLVLFGPQWSEAAPLLTILAFGGAWYPIQLLNEQLLLAKGRSDTVFRLSLMRKAIGIACVAAGSFAGLIGLAWGQTAGMVIGAGLGMSASGSLFGYGLRSQMREMWKPFVGSAAMAAMLSLTNPLIGLPPLAKLLLLIAIGGSTYLAVSALLRTRALFELIHSARTWHRAA